MLMVPTLTQFPTESKRKMFPPAVRPFPPLTVVRQAADGQQKGPPVVREPWLPFERDLYPRAAGPGLPEGNP